MMCLRGVLLVLLWSTIAAKGQFSYSNYNNTVIITKYVGTDTVVNIPDTIGGLPVVTLGNSCFSRATNVTSVAIPDSVTNLLNSVFYQCFSLTNVSMPTRIATMGDSVFWRCFNLSKVMLPQGVSTIGEDMFYQCTNLSSVNIPSGVTSIGVNAFYECYQLRSIVLPSTLNSMGFGAFTLATNLTSVYFQGNVPSSGTYVFAYDPLATAYFMPGSTGWSTNFEGLPTVEWNPQIQTGDGSFGPRPEGFGFNIVGPTNLTVVVVASTNAADPVWIPVGTNTLLGGSSYFLDPNWTEASARLYRLRSP